jgi:error-prone DNA polymerase
MLPKMQSREFSDIVVEVAIVRPGPIQGKMIHPYLQRRQGLEEVTYPHPKLEPVLRETLGVIIFQEQVLRVASVVGGFTPGEGELLRRAMSRKRSYEEIEKLRVRFVRGAMRNGLSEAEANQVFDQLAAFGGYGFCKGHAAAFARTTYETAYLKLCHPLAFYPALLNNQWKRSMASSTIVTGVMLHRPPTWSRKSSV